MDDTVIRSFNLETTAVDQPSGSFRIYLYIFVPELTSSACTYG